MKLYYRKDPKIVSTHKDSIRWFQDGLNLSDYQLLWVTFLKGILFGAGLVTLLTQTSVLTYISKFL